MVVDFPTNLVDFVFIFQNILAFRFLFNHQEKGHKKSSPEVRGAISFEGNLKSKAVV
jgi:hypothetical protein